MAHTRATWIVFGVVLVLVVYWNVALYALHNYPRVRRGLAFDPVCKGTILGKGSRGLECTPWTPDDGINIWVTLVYVVMSMIVAAYSIVFLGAFSVAIWGLFKNNPSEMTLASTAALLCCATAYAWVR